MANKGGGGAAKQGGGKTQAGRQGAGKPRAGWPAKPKRNKPVRKMSGDDRDNNPPKATRR